MVLWLVKDIIRTGKVRGFQFCVDDNYYYVMVYKPHPFLLFDLETHNYGDGILSVNIVTLYTKILLQEQDILINIMLLAIVSQDDRKKTLHDEQ